MSLDATDRDILLAALADPEAAWSLGAFGAAAEFRRRTDEPSVRREDGLALRTEGGGIALALPETVRPVSYETPVGAGWSHAVALCLPATALDGTPHTRVTELGPDLDALAPDRRGAVSFDLGLGLAQVSVRVRTGGSALARLRALRDGPAPDFDATIRPEMAAGHADLVFVGPLGRIEVLGGCAADPSGPRAYVVPKVLRRRMSHAATAPIPPGWVPVAHLHPPHPCRDEAGAPRPFDRARHAAFQALLVRWGDRDGVALKAAFAAGDPLPRHEATRRTRAVLRVAHAQALCLARRD